MSRRYRTEKQILAAIDRCQEEAKKQFMLAEMYMNDVEAIRKRNDPAEAWMAEDKGKMARAALRKGQNLMDKRLKKLGEKLAEFRTRILPFIADQDPSIPVKVRGE